MKRDTLFTWAGWERGAPAKTGCKILDDIDPVEARGRYHEGYT